MCFSSWRKKPPPEETVSKAAHDNFVLAYDALLEDNKRLVQEMADLTGKVTALGFDEALMRGLALKAVALLERVSTTHRASPNFKREIDALVAEARSAGLVEEKSKEV